MQGRQEVPWAIVTVHLCAGMLACWNHPFEVARIEAQARGDQNQKDLNMVQIFRMIVKEQVTHLQCFYAMPTSANAHCITFEPSLDTQPAHADLAFEPRSPAF